MARFGCSLEIHTDQWINFESELFKEMHDFLEKKMVKQGPQVTDHLRMVKWNDVIHVDQLYKLLDIVWVMGRRDGMNLWG